MTSRQKKLGSVLLVITLTLVIWIGSSLSGNRSDRLIALDVGQGDALFIDLASGRQVLIDGGAGEAVVRALGEVMLPWDRSIDLVVLSHPDRDHLEGLLSVLERYQVNTVLTRTLSDVRTPLYNKWQDRLSSSDVEVIEASSGQRLTLDAAHWLEVYVDTTPGLDTNDRSILLTLNREAECLALFTGDASIQVEKRLIASAPLMIDCDVLKVGHHGSKFSTSTALIEAVSPTAALIGVGKNSYGHPHPEVLGRLSSIEVLRTDQLGSVILKL